MLEEKKKMELLDGCLPLELLSPVRWSERGSGSSHVLLQHPGFSVSTIYSILPQLGSSDTANH